MSGRPDLGGESTPRRVRSTELIGCLKPLDYGSGMTEGDQDDSGPFQLQLQQAVETFRFQMGLLVQVWGFLITADAILIGYSLSQRKSVLIAVASVMPVLMLLAVRAIYTHSLPFIYTAIGIERQLMPDRDTLAASYTRMKFPLLYNKILATLDLGDPNLSDAIVESGFPGRWSGVGMRRLFIVGFLSHLTLFVLALAVFHYPFM